MTQPRNNEQHAASAGSSILTEWRAKRQAARVQAEGVPVSGITPGTEAYSWLTGHMGPGRAISERSAMSTSAVYASVSLIGGAIASLTLETYQTDGDSRRKYRPPLWWLLNEQMHPRWAAPVAWEFCSQSLLLQGDMFIRIHRVSPYSPDVKWLEPMHPLCVEVREIAPDRLVYIQYTRWGTVVLDQDDVIHVPGPGFDGKRGMSQIRHVLRQAVSIAMASGEQSETMLDGGLRPDLVLKAGEKLNSEQIDKLRNQWLERYSGARNSTAPVVLSNNMDVKEISMSPQDAQLLENQKYSVEDIARIFGVPPFMIGQTDKTTSWGSGVEQMGIGFVKYTLQRHLVKIEQEINRKLFKTARNFVEFNAATLERGDFKSRNEGYRIGLGRAGEPAWLTVNEVRRMENLPPIDGGDQLPTFEATPNAPEPDPATAE
jgi:HK97 family phage portal protein